MQQSVFIHTVLGARAMLTSKRHLHQEKPNCEFRIPPPTPSASPRKKQKSSDMPDVLEIDGIDVVTVSGIDLEGEQKQLFSGPKKRRQIFLKSSRIAEELNAGAILQKIPLGRKLKEITSKFGISSISTDVEQCLLLAVEEMLRRMIHNMIRVSKKRLLEKSDHHINILITSDIQREIMLLNQKLDYPEEKMFCIPSTEDSGDIFVEPQKTVKDVSIRDVMTVLEREPQMLKSTQLYCLHEKVKGSANAV